MQKILVVNNDIDTMSLLQNWLEKKSYQVKFTGNRDEVPQLLENFKPDLMLVDILKKEVIPEIKNNGNGNDIPVILMSGYSHRQKAKDIAADDVIEKPFDLDLLQKKINKLIA